MANNALEVVIEEVATTEKSVYVRLIGSLDTMTANEAQVELFRIAETLAGAEFVLDLADLTYISSAGLRVMLLLNKESADKGFDLKLADLSTEVRSVFEMVGFSKLFVIE
jgi:anti-anti-sigma factor